MFDFLISGASWLFGNSKAADAAVKSIDALVFTPEEKAAADQKILDFKIEYAKATQGQSIARRFIAVTVTLLWAVLVITTTITGLIDASDTSHYIFLSGIMENVINKPFMIIIGFYFLAHVVKR